MQGRTEVTTQSIQSAAGQQLVPDFKTLQRLRQSCRVSLERYIDLASQTSGHLSRLTPGTIDNLGRANLALLQQREEKAHETYLRARAALRKYVLDECEYSDSSAA